MGCKEACSYAATEVGLKELKQQTKYRILAQFLLHLSKKLAVKQVTGDVLLQFYLPALG